MLRVRWPYPFGRRTEYRIPCAGLSQRAHNMHQRQPNRRHEFSIPVQDVVLCIPGSAQLPSFSPLLWPLRACLDAF